MTTYIAPWLDESRWPTVPIRYVARLGTGHTPSRQHPEYWENCTLPWVTLADVGQLRTGMITYIYTTSEKISQLGIANSSAVKHPAGTVILSRTASVGFSAILGTAMATSQDFATWTCSSRLEPRYLLHALRAMTPDLRRIAMGSTHQTIYMPDIAELRVPIPPTAEQRRITDFLDTETARIDSARTQMLTLSTLLTEREQAFLDDAIDRLADRFGTLPLRRYITAIEQGTSPQCDNLVATDGEWGVLKVSAVKAGRFEPNENKRLPDDIPPVRRYEIRHGDLLITRANTPKLVGATAVAHQPRRHLLLCDKIFRIDVDPQVNKDYIALVARGRRIRGLCAEASHGTSQSMANLKANEIKDWPIPSAPLAMQLDTLRRTSYEFDKLATLRALVDSQAALLAERKQALITASVTGMLDLSTTRAANLP